MEVVRFVACICLVIAPAVAIESALKNQGLDTRAVCSVQELSTRLFDSFCEHGQPLVEIDLPVAVPTRSGHSLLVSSSCFAGPTNKECSVAIL